MPRHGGRSRERTRKHRKRRGRNGQSYHDRVANGSIKPAGRKTRRKKEQRP